MTQIAPRGGSTGQPQAVPPDVTLPGRRGAKSHHRPDDNSPTRIPSSGETVFGFSLRRELGRGAYARVFLAEQADLAGRPVALKITNLDGDEPQTLAQLQHTHIVPIYSVHENHMNGLRAVCMPYFGGACLAEVLQTLWAETSRPTKGEQLVRALEVAAKPKVSASAKTPLPGDAAPGTAAKESGAAASDSAASTTGAESPLTILRGMSYIRATAWIVARLAEALQHAHQRKVIHRDVKPSNVLMGGDGQPMLLDFNVAQTSRNSQLVASLGGTAAYMAPEHLRAMAQRDQDLAARVDHRADLYSLGMVLYEMLAGGRPFAATSGYSGALPALEAMAHERSQVIPSARSKRSDVPWSLESIVRKCLCPDPAGRYQHAEQVAEDLRRFLEDRPLRYAPELSWRERAQKWLRRHPRLTSSGTVAVAAAVLLAGVGASLVGVQQHLAQTSEELVGAQARDTMQAFEAGTLRALCLVNTTSEVQDHQRQGIVVCKETLALYGVLDSDSWQQHPHWQRLAAEDRERLAEDTRELLLSLAWAEVHGNPKDPVVLTRALTLLQRAEAISSLAPCRAIWENRAVYLERLGRAKEAELARKTAETIPPVSARDHYLLATTYARSGKYDQAVQELDQALRLNPRHYWSLVQRGICHQEMGRYALAAGDFGACIGVWPDFAWGFFNRAYVMEKSGHRLEAINDYTAALERDPRFLLAYLNRGLARLELKQYEPALADFRKAAALGRDDATLHLGKGVALEKLGQHAEADAAFAAALTRAAAAAPAVRTRIRWVYGFAVCERLPAKAWQAFGDVLRDHPEHSQALYGQAMLLVRQKRTAEALVLLDRALESTPDFSEARRYRAILHARVGQFDAASRDINACLERDPQGGATLYAAACVAALALEKCNDPAVAKQVADQALILLEKALAQGYGRDTARTDADLTALRTLPEFAALLKVKGL